MGVVAGVVGGVQPAFEVGQVRRGRLGRVGESGTDHVRWRVVVHPGDDRCGAAVVLADRLVVDVAGDPGRPVGVPFVELGAHAGYPRDHVVRGVRVAGGDDHVPG